MYVSTRGVSIKKKISQGIFIKVNEIRGYLRSGQRDLNEGHFYYKILDTLKISI